MNKIPYIILLTFFLIACNDIADSSKTDNQPQYRQLCVFSSNDSIKKCVPASKDLYKDVYQILGKIELYHLVPDSGKYKGRPKQIITDTLGGEVLTDTVFPDGTGFHMDDFYYNKYEYDGIGLLKKYTYIDNGKPEDCIEVSYLYQENNLREILAINPSQSTSYDNQGKNSIEMFVPDTLYKLKLIYKTDNVLDRIIVEKDSINTLYSIMYKY